MRGLDPEWGGPAGHYHQLIPEHVKGDVWLHDQTRNVLVRFHARGRRYTFNPAKAKLPSGIRIESLTGRRRTLAMSRDQSLKFEDNWRREASSDLQFTWVGRTEFELLETRVLYRQAAFLLRASESPFADIFSEPLGS